MTELKGYIDQFSKLRRAPGQVWTEATRKQAPHKPLLLLALLDLVARGVVASPFIDVREDLVELNELFTNYWRKVVPIRQTSSIAFPFSRLHNEPFWELVPVESQTIDRRVINSINNVNQLRQVAIGGRIAPELHALMLQEENRAVLRQTLLERHFSAGAITALNEQAAIHAEAYSYNLVLISKAHQPLVKEAVLQGQYRPASRNQGFRRAVVTTYDHRCALCGVRIVTAEGHTVVDAAHIVPWRKTQNDDIRNGMALCKLCHWAFDEGILGVSDGYAVIISSQISLSPNVPGSLQTLSGRSIIAPPDRDLWPSQEYLHWHRRESRLA
ncbi:MAG: HNH endonuclease [Desulfuromonadales bacterium]|nr:HNH endonuclease [Desulfuromonadales bacterium]